MMSKGEYRVGTGFNPSGDTAVDEIKYTAAQLVNMIERIPTADIPERQRLKALAQTAIEEGAMWAVKAATKGEQK